jgi:hypothetical protein
MTIRLAPRFGADDRGGVILIVLTLGGMLSALAATLIGLSVTERGVAGNHQAGIRALYAAEALAERIVLDLAADLDWTPILSGTRVSPFFETGSRLLTPWGEGLDLAAITDVLQRQTDRTSSGGPDTPQWRIFASGPVASLVGAGYDVPIFVAGWVADDEAETDGEPRADSNGRVVVRVEARGFGSLNRRVQVVIGRRDDPSTTGAGAGGADSAAETAGVRIVSWREVT